MNLAENRYGKSKARVARLVRTGNRHDFYEMTVAIALEGDFEASCRAGDNALVLPTDTMKNTVYALAHWQRIFRSFQACFVRENRHLWSFMVSQRSVFVHRGASAPARREGGGHGRAGVGRIRRGGPDSGDLARCHLARGSGLGCGDEDHHRHVCRTPASPCNILYLYTPWARLACSSSGRLKGSG
jgi:hypothetical protein